VELQDGWSPQRLWTLLREIEPESLDWTKLAAFCHGGDDSTDLITADILRELGLQPLLR
jgi:hypothetical protein